MGLPAQWQAAHSPANAPRGPPRTAAINLTGNANGNEVRGNNGTNVLNGGGGHDQLTGGGGQDSFRFDSAINADNFAEITDFTIGVDRIHLEDTVFGAFAAGDLAAERLPTARDDRVPEVRSSKREHGTCSPDGVQDGKPPVPQGTAPRPAFVHLAGQRDGVISTTGNAPCRRSREISGMT